MNGGSNEISNLPTDSVPTDSVSTGSVSTSFVSTNALSIILKSTKLTVKSWLSIFILILLRTAISVAGFLPPILLVTFFIRIVVAGSIGAYEGLTSIEEVANLVLSDTSYLIVLSLIISGVYVIQFVLLSLADAGLFGELAQALKENRDVEPGGFLRYALEYFPRFAAFRIIYTFFSFLIIVGTLAAISLIIWGYLPELKEVGSSFSSSFIILVALVCSLSMLSFIVLLLTSVASAAAYAFDGYSITKSIYRGLQFIRENAVSLSVIFSFFLAIFAIWITLELGGSMLWLKVIEITSYSSFASNLANAWSTAFAVMWLVFWVWIIATQLVMYNNWRSKS